MFYAETNGTMHVASVSPFTDGWYRTSIPGKASGKSGIVASRAYTVQEQIDVFYAGDDGKLHATDSRHGGPWTEHTLEQSDDVAASSDLSAFEQRGVDGGQIDTLYTDSHKRLHAAYNNHNAKGWQDNEFHFWAE